MFAVAFKQVHLLVVLVATALGIDNIKALAVIGTNNIVVFVVVYRENPFFLCDFSGLFQPSV